MASDGVVANPTYMADIRFFFRHVVLRNDVDYLENVVDGSEIVLVSRDDKVVPKAKAVSDQLI